MNFKVKDNIEIEYIDENNEEEDVMLFDNLANQIVIVNSTCGRLIEKIKAGKKITEIIEEFVEIYGEQYQTIKDGIEQIIPEIIELNLIEEV